MRLFRRRVRSQIAGVVISVRVGSRCRVTVQDAEGNTHTHFMSEVKTKHGRKVRKGTALGYR